MTVTSIQRDWGQEPCIVRMKTDSFIEDIVKTGWLGSEQDSINKVNNGGFTWDESDTILLSYPLNQNDPTGQQAKTLVYVFPDFKSVNPIPPIYPNLQNVTAHAGSGQANASQMIIGINVVTTVATPGDSVKLPNDVLSQFVLIANRGANALDVFPSLNDSINTFPINASFTIAAGSAVMFIGVTDTNWATII